MQVIDFVLGRHLSENFIKTVYIRRFEIEDDGLDSLYKVTNLIYTELNQAWSSVARLPYDIDTIMRTLGQLVTSLSHGNVTDTASYKRLREILSLFAVKDYEIYLIKRLDLQVSNYTPGTKAYLIDKNDDLYPTLNRVSNGFGINFPVATDACLSNVVFSFIQSILTLDEVTKELIQLKALTEQFQALKSVGASNQMPMDNLMKFFTDLGYKFIVAIDA
jgi:hypothetical protein